MAEWSIASDLKSDELYRFREFESHSLLLFLYKIDYNKELLKQSLNLPISKLK